VADTLLDRQAPDGTLVLDEVRLSDQSLREADKVFIVACGSSYHAAMVAKYAIERWTRLPTEVDIASEFRYRDPVLDERTLAVGVSQSGETVDTIQAMREARRWGAKVLVVSNVVDSSMAARPTVSSTPAPGPRSASPPPRRTSPRSWPSSWWPSSSPSCAALSRPRRSLRSSVSSRPCRPPRAHFGALRRRGCGGRRAARRT